MKIDKEIHKSILFQCFYVFIKDAKGNLLMDQKTYDLDKLSQAGEAFKKLNGQRDVTKVENMVKITFSDEPVEFTPDETVILRQNFDEEAKRLSTPDNAQGILELEDLFKGENGTKEGKE